MWEIRRYRKDSRKEWDEFVTQSRNGTFLFLRDYMDYHSDRFEDCSLMAYRRGTMAAILPANIKDATLHSHQGLTYGGWVLPMRGLDVADIIALWKAWMGWCLEEGIREVIYKPVPYIYHKMPSEEDKYLMFLCNGRLTTSNISSAIDLSRNPGFNKLQKRHLKHLSPEIRISKVSPEQKEVICGFHDILTECLQSRHGVDAVHSKSEMIMLTERFPENLELWIASDNVEMYGGVLIYLTSECAHCQYIATNFRGRKENVLATLFHHIIRYYTDKGIRYFDFGTSNEKDGRYLNEGLNRQKTSYGGSGVSYQTYSLYPNVSLDLLNKNE